MYRILIDEARRSKEYRAFINEVTLFVPTGKNKHDDSCDSLAMLVEFLILGAAW